MPEAFDNKFLWKDRDTEPMIKLPLWSAYRENISSVDFQGGAEQWRSASPLHSQKETFNKKSSLFSSQQDGFSEESNSEEAFFQTEQLYDSPLLNLVQEYNKNTLGEERVAFLETLERQDTASKYLLLLALTDDFWDVRATAAQKLGYFNEETPVTDLIHAYQRDDDDSVREAIVRALGRQKQTVLASWFVSVLYEDISWLVREAAAWALGELSKDAPVGPLVKALQCDLDDSVRAAAARSLGRSGKREVEAALFEALNDEELEVQEAAALALQELDPETRGIKQRDMLIIFDEVHRSPYLEANENPVIAQHDLHTRMDEAVLTLRHFIQDKQGYVYSSKTFQSKHGLVLFLICLYQRTERSFQETERHLIELDTQIEPLESALKNEDEAIQKEMQQAFVLGKTRPWRDLLVVSFDFSSLPKMKEKQQLPFKIVLAGMGCDQVRKSDHSLLSQIVRKWSENTQLQDSLFLDRSCDLTDIKVWYQSGGPFSDYPLSQLA